jgi:hypothetical protein
MFILYSKKERKNKIKSFFLLSLLSFFSKENIDINAKNERGHFGTKNALAVKLGTQSMHWL